MIRKVLFLVAVSLVSFSFSGSQNFFKRIWPFGKKNENHTIVASVKVVPTNVSHPDIATAKKADPFNIIVILALCLVVLLLGIDISCSSRPFKTKASLPRLLVEPFFMPHDGPNCIKRLYHDLQDAEEKICIASYWVTHLNIIKALRMARKRNVSIEIILDKSTPNASTLQQQFQSCGIQFTISEVDSARMHHKFIIIDDTITWIGSANLTGTAFSKNYENMLRIQSPEIARRYLTDFNYLMLEFAQSSHKTQQSTGHLHTQQVATATNSGRPGKPISDYQKRFLEDFGICSNELNYDEAYVMIDKIINSAWRLHVRGH